MSTSILGHDTTLQRTPLLLTRNATDSRATRSRPRSRSGGLTNQDERHRCTTCLRDFRRRDALTRHSFIHDKNRERPKVRRKACGSCVRSKIKCPGEKPICSSCVKRNHHCEYTAVQSSPKSPTSHVPPSTTELQSVFDQDATSTSVQQSEATMHNVTDTAITHYYDQHADLRYTTPSQPPAMFDFGSIFADASYNPNFESVAWIFEENLDEVFPSVPASPRHNLSAFTLGNADVQQAQNLEQEYQQTIIGSEELEDLPQPTPRDHCSPDDVWPMEWHASSAQHLVLPTLGSVGEDFEVSSGSFYAVANITEQARARMENSIRLPLERTPWQTVSLAHFPSKEKLDHCIDLFFRHFDRTFTVIHRPTFNPGKFPVLTLSMASAGACYTNFEGAQGFSNSLSELVRRLLIFMAEYDPRFLRSDQYLAAKLIQSVQGYCGASRRLFELSESSRSSLVHNARSMGLFCYKAPIVERNLSVEDSWHQWIDHEKYRRLGWAVYLIDSSVSYLHNSRPYLSVSDIDMEMPSSNDYWQAESAYSWSALHPWTDNTPLPLRFRPLCRSLLDETNYPIMKLNPAHHRYFILTLIRMIWGLKEMSGSPMSGLAGVTGQLNIGRKHLQDILDRFLHIRITLPLCTPLSQRELADAYRESQMIHMSHLYGAGDLMDWLYTLLRDPELESTRIRMTQWAAQDDARVREVAYHSSQVLAILRNFQANYPLEPFTAFHAGAVLWCAAQVLPRPNRPVNGSFLRLDKIPVNEEEFFAAKEWISSGSTLHVSVFGVPDLTSENGKEQVLEQTGALLRRMTCWSISQNFLKVIMALMVRD